MRTYLYNTITDKTSGFLAEATRSALLILSFAYSFFVWLKNIAYENKLLRPDSVEAKVISVGNITWGGTGKTSMVMLISEFLLSKGRKVAVLSRGYKSRGKADPKDAGFEYRAIGDEPYLLKEKFPHLPVLVGRDRVSSAIKAIKEFQSNTIILDDAFGHRRINRDLDIVLVDVLDPFGNGYLLPRGILREPLEALSRADIIVLTNCEFAREKQKKLWFDISWINDSALIVYSSYRFKRLYDIANRQTIDRAEVSLRPVCILASIGNFSSFKLSVDSFLKVDVKLELNLPDHYEYSKEYVRATLDTCRKAAIETIITTEKDAVRLRPWLSDSPGVKIIILEVILEIIENKERFFEAILNACNS